MQQHTYVWSKGPPYTPCVSQPLRSTLVENIPLLLSAQTLRSVTAGEMLVRGTTLNASPLHQSSTHDVIVSLL